MFACSTLLWLCELVLNFLLICESWACDKHTLLEQLQFYLENPLKENYKLGFQFEKTNMKFLTDPQEIWQSQQKRRNVFFSVIFLPFTLITSIKKERILLHQQKQPKWKLDTRMSGKKMGSLLPISVSQYVSLDHSSSSSVCGLVCPNFVFEYVSQDAVCVV